MNVADAIETRRAYRSLEPSEITDELISDLARHADLAPSCNNNQPWRFVFMRDSSQLTKIHTALPKNNKWIELASMLMAVCARSVHPYLTESQAAGEKERFARYPFEKFAFIDRYAPPTPP